MKKLLSVACICMLTACAGPTVNDYAANQPTMVVNQFFNGPMSAHGIVKDRSGKVTRRFTASINASWQNGIGTLDEKFVFDDGEKQSRIWTLTPDKQGSYTGTASDVVGSSTLQAAGNALFLNYTLRVPYKSSTLDIKIDDRMYLINEKLLINESKMSKWGFDVGQITLVIEK